MAILFDLDGVFYQGNKRLKGAVEVVEWVKQEGIPYLFVTNTSSRPRRELLVKLDNLGIQTDQAHLFTPAVAAVDWLQQQPDRQCPALFVPESTRVEFASLPVWQEDDKEVTAVVVGEMGNCWTFEQLNLAFRLLMKRPQPRLLALGMTRYWQADDGLRLDVAPFIVALEYAADVRALVMGKPAKLFYQTALNMLGDTAENTIMVGDDVRGDVEGAQNAGIKGVLVKTGKFRATDLLLNIQPDGVLGSIADLPSWWQQYH